MTKCENCIWKAQCAEAEIEICEDFSPFDDRIEVEAYEADLAERQAEYEVVLSEMND